MASLFAIKRKPAVTKQVVEWIDQTVAVITGEGGSGKSSAITSTLSQSPSEQPNRSGSKLTAINLWSAYDLHLSDFWELEGGLKSCFRAARQERPYPTTPEAAARTFLRAHEDDPRKYPRLESLAERVAYHLIKGSEWLIIDGCEHWHDPSLMSETPGVLTTRVHPLVASLVGELVDAGDRFQGKLIVTHRRGLPEVPRSQTHAVPDLGEDEIEDYFAGRRMPTGGRLVTLFGAVSARRPLDWRAIAEYFATAGEGVVPNDDVEQFVEAVERSHGPLDAALAKIDEIERGRSDSQWGITAFTGLFDRPASLTELQKVSEVPGLNGRLPRSKSDRERLSKRLARTGLVSFNSFKYATATHPKASAGSRTSDWWLDAHQEVRAVYARRLRERDENERLSRRAHALLAKEYFQAARAELPAPPQFGKGSPPSLGAWSEAFSRGMFHTTKVGLEATYRAFRTEYWDAVLGHYECRLLVDYDSVAEDYRALSLIASRIGAGRTFPRSPKGREVDRAVFLSLYALSNWHIGNLLQARALFLQAVSAWDGLGGKLNRTEAIRRVAEVDLMLGRVASAVRYSELATHSLADADSRSDDDSLPKLRPVALGRMVDGTRARAFHFAGRRAEAAEIFQRHQATMFDAPEHWSVVWWYWWATLRLEGLELEFDASVLAAVRGEIATWERDLSELRRTKQRYYSLDHALLCLVGGLADLAELRGTRASPEGLDALLSSARANLDRAVEFGQQCSQRPHLAGCYLGMADYCVEVGEPLKSEQYLARAKRAATPMHASQDLPVRPGREEDGRYWSWLADALVVRARLEIARGDLPAADEAIRTGEAVVQQLAYSRLGRPLHHQKKLITELSKSYNAIVPRKQRNDIPQPKTPRAGAEAEWSDELQVPLTIEVLRARLQAAKDRSGLTGKEIGVLMGYPETSAGQSLNNILNHTTNPGIFTLLRFATAVECDLADLVGPQTR